MAPQPDCRGVVTFVAGYPHDDIGFVEIFFDEDNPQIQEWGDLKREPGESFEAFVQRIRDTEEPVGEEPALLVFGGEEKIDFDAVKRVRIRHGNVYDRNPGESWADFERRFVEAELHADAAKTPA
jgi:broad specificity phosphatase PhoE